MTECANEACLTRRHPTKPIARRRAIALIEEAYPTWTPCEAETALDHPGLDLDLGHGRKLVNYPSAKPSTGAVIGLTYTGR